MARIGSAINATAMLSLCVLLLASIGSAVASPEGWATPKQPGR